MTEQQHTSPKEGGFMGTIWKITLFSMLGTACVGYAINLVALDRAHEKNMQEVAKIDYRIAEFKAYTELYQKEGKAAADARFIKK